MSRDLAMDVVVLGAGLAGMSAAASAAERGCRVLVLECAPTIGGSAAMSGGYVWTVENLDVLSEEDPGEHQRHGHHVVGGYSAISAWLESFAEPLTEEQPNLNGRGRKFDIPLVIATMARTISAAGGDIAVGSRVVDVEVDAGSYRLSIRDDDGDLTVRAPALILATGGRQADPNVRRSLTGGATLPPLRGNAWSRGDGAALAVSLGGRINHANRGFYGHLFADGVQPIAPLDFIAFALYQSEEGIMFDRAGRRFTDETRGDHNNAMAVAEMGGHALLFWSEDAQNRAAGRPFVGGSLPMDRWGFSRDRGGRVGSASTSAELVVLAREWGYRLDASGLDDPFVSERLGPGRIFAADVVPAVTMTFGGIEVDDGGATLDDDGLAIPGVFVAGGDCSDIYHRGYAGGLCAAAVTGHRAGAHAAGLALVPGASAATRGVTAQPRS